MNCWRCESTDNLIYQDRLYKLFLSTEPMTLGHCILTSVEHWPNIENMGENDYRQIQSAIYHWNGILKEVFKVQDVFILFMNHHEPEEKHVYWHLLPIHKSVKPDFRYNYTWFGERAKEVNARSKEQNSADVMIAGVALKRYSNE